MVSGSIDDLTCNSGSSILLPGYNLTNRGIHNDGDRNTAGRDEPRYGVRNIRGRILRCATRPDAARVRRVAVLLECPGPRGGQSGIFRGRAESTWVFLWRTA